jgi:DNA-binding NarL/FixJ family response regulator
VTFSVLIVDDSRSFLDVGRDLLERQGVRVVGLASTSAEALRQSAELHPEVILIDITLAGESGFDLARRLAERRRGAAGMILISTHPQADFADLIDESPAAGFLSKSELSAGAIRQIAGGMPGAHVR